MTKPIAYSSMEKHAFTESAEGLWAAAGRHSGASCTTESADNWLCRHLEIHRNILEQCATRTTLTLLPPTPVQVDRSGRGSAEGSPWDTLQP